MPRPSSSPRSSLMVWLQLLRAPNLLTVPGDPLAGYCLAAGSTAIATWAIGPAVAAAICLYAAGLLLNDYADREIDARERPQRPLPSGLVRPRAVGSAGWALLLAGVVVAFLAGRKSGWLAVALAGLIVAYDFYLKPWPVVGPLAMGACRGLSLWMGAGVVAMPGSVSLAWIGGLITTLYIASVTQVAREEMSGARAGLWRWGPAAVLLAGAALLKAKGQSNFDWAGIIGFMPAWIIVLMGGWRLGGQNSASLIPGIIGKWIGALVLLQAGLMLGAASGSRFALLMSAVALLLWGANQVLARKFYSS